MSIHTVHLVNCDRDCGAQHIPRRDRTPAGARKDARDNGWTRTEVPNDTGYPADLGKQMTGLPIDFQIQPASWANKHYPHSRSALIELEPTNPERPDA
jgi:hypothetical protein